jgi:hypothetical protein
MILQSLSYLEFENDSRRWELENFDLNTINLLVGKNASGKTRITNVIYGFAGFFLNSRIPVRFGQYKTCFKHDGKTYIYDIYIDNGVITKELLTIDSDIFIERYKNGEGFICNAQNERQSFKIPTDELISTRKDEKNYPFLNLFYDWAVLVRLFKFTSERTKQTISIVDTNTPHTPQFNLKETDKAIGVLSLGLQKYGDAFKNSIIADFNKIGYNISSISIGKLVTIEMDDVIRGSVEGILVQEKDLKIVTDQVGMSDGMFRALSIILHFNYYNFEGTHGCVIIDDIGEGLDYERSTNLIQLLIEKAEDNSLIQLIMSTNDKFIMNETKLEYWQIVSRNGSLVKLYNQKNNQEIFDQFKYTGLNNFDFFSTDFYKTGFEDFEQENV